MRLAAFPSVKTLEQFDFEAAPGMPKARIQELAGLAFIERRENVIFLGPSLLILHEIGYLPLKKEQADMFFRVVAKPYEHGSVILTSNLSFGVGEETFDGNAALTSTMLGRLLAAAPRPRYPDTRRELPATASQTEWADRKKSD